MGLTWVAVEAKTGVIIADLPDLAVEGNKLKHVIGRYDTVSMSLPIPTAPENWERATLESATNLILLQDNPADPAHGIPVWGGMIRTTNRTEQDTLAMSVSTIETYMDARYVGNQTFTGVGQNTILNTLITNYVATGPNGGIPLRVDYTGAGTLRTRTYADADNMTVYAAFQNFSGIQGGPEWTIDWEWQYSPDRLTPVMKIASRIGTATPAGLSPAATFEMPGPVISFSAPSDYSNGRGANVVTAYSTGNTTARPSSNPQIVTDPNRPTFEFRWTPSTSISDTTTLDSYAATAVAAMAKGTRTIELTAVMQDAPKYGVDWVNGDDIGYSVGMQGEVPAFPNGKAGIARAFGVEFDISDTPLVTPILSSSTV